MADNVEEGYLPCNERPRSVTTGPQLFQPKAAKFRIRQMGAIMYALANIDFSDRLGFVVSTPQPDEIDSQDQTLDTKRSLPTSALEEAVFGAA